MCLSLPPLLLPRSPLLSPLQPKNICGGREQSSFLSYPYLSQTYVARIIRRGGTKHTGHSIEADDSRLPVLITRTHSPQRRAKIPIAARSGFPGERGISSVVVPSRLSLAPHGPEADGGDGLQVDLRLELRNLLRPPVLARRALVVFVSDEPRG